ncbi:MAG: heme-dependent peroxidase [Mariniblastus sp.]|nr:heme-dependent peroxidase [Mariniblastus sp.]
MNFNIKDMGHELSDVCPSNGWHCSHFFYRFDRARLASLTASQIETGRDQWTQLLDSTTPNAPARLQVGLVSGHKADFSLMVMDPDPIRVESMHQELMSGPLGVALQPTYSYVSFSEISEYVQSVEQYAKRLARSGEDPESSAFQTKLAAYTERQKKMNYQRLTPNFPDWPVSCFYPMNKWRYPGANWFSLPFSERNRLMAEHARSGIKFAGKVTQLITVGIGLDDWEWGVTLWATNPEHLKQIVYDMRFDEASAKYAEFGPFYTSYRCQAKQVLEACRVV